MVVAAAALFAACTTDAGDPAPASGSASASTPPPKPVWSAAVRPVEPPVAVADGFAMTAFAADRSFEVVSVAAADGRIRWRAPASPSRVDHGVGLSVETVDAGRAVVWMAPGRVYTAGDVSVVAADAATGARRWSYGGGRLQLHIAPFACREDTAVCFLVYPQGTTNPRAVILDAGSGRVLSDRPAPFEGAVRSLAQGLYDAGTELAAVDEQGQLKWHRPAAAAFGAPVDPNFGWTIKLVDGRYVGTLGRVRSTAPAADAAPVPVQDLAATAALDAATGRTIWTRPRDSAFCGQLQFDAEHPVLCTSTGQARISDKLPSVTDLDVTLNGVDLATGRNRWTARLGDVPGLWRAGPEVLRVDDTTYTIRAPQSLVRLDLDRGVQPGPAPDTGWCSIEATVTPRQNVRGVNPDEVVAYQADQWSPCRLGGETVDAPAGPARFAGATVDKVFAFVGRAGNLKAIRTS